MGIVTLRILATASLALVSAASAVAQIPGFPQIPNIEYNPLLLMNPQVQKELRLSPTNASKVQTTFMSEAMKILPVVTSQPGKARLSPAERNRRTFAAVNVMVGRLAALLTPPQRVRLRQLTLQSIGPAAVLQPKVGAALGLTGGQRSSLMRSISDSNARMAGQMQNGRTVRDWQARMPELTRLQNAAKAEGNQALMATLTASQRAKWKAMLGKPFTLSGFLGVGPMGLGG